MDIWDGAAIRSVGEKLTSLISAKKPTDSILTCGKDIYHQIMGIYPKGMLDAGGTMVYHGLEVRLDESKPVDYVSVS